MSGNVDAGAANAMLHHPGHMSNQVPVRACNVCSVTTHECRAGRKDNSNHHNLHHAKDEPTGRSMRTSFKYGRTAGGACWSTHVLS